MNSSTEREEKDFLLRKREEVEEEEELRNVPSAQFPVYIILESCFYSLFFRLILFPLIW